MKKALQEAWRDLDEPLELPESASAVRKKGKLKVTIIFEDGSYKEYYKKLGVAYFFTIKKRKYLVLPECIMRGKNPSIIYYFNNPWPLKFEHSISNFKAIDLYEKEIKDILPADIKIFLMNAYIDAEVLQSAFTSNWLKAMYAKPGLTTKAIIIIMVVIVVIVLIVLQVTGAVDVIGFFRGG